MKKARYVMVAYILIFTFILSACGATPTPQVIVVTATSLPATEAPTVAPTPTFAPVALSGPQNGSSMKWVDGSTLAKYRRPVANSAQCSKLGGRKNSSGSPPDARNIRKHCRRQREDGIKGCCVGRRNQAIEYKPRRRTDDIVDRQTALWLKHFSGLPGR